MKIYLIVGERSGDQHAAKIVEELKKDKNVIIRGWGGDDLKSLHARCSMVKLYSTEMANRVADRCLQIWGGRGYRRDNAVERFFREVRVDRIWEGSSEMQRMVIARALQKRGLKGM